MTPEETFKQNLLGLLDSYKSANDDDDFVLICAREKDGDDYKFNMACVSTQNYTKELHDFHMDSFKKLPTFVINAKWDVLKTIEKVLKNLIFS